MQRYEDNLPCSEYLRSPFSFIELLQSGTSAALNWEGLNMTFCGVRNVWTQVKLWSKGSLLSVEGDLTLC